MTFVSSNTAANDIWLRTDGSNSMHSSIVFDSADPYSRQILGASLVQNIAGQALLLGSGSGLTAVTSAGVVIDSGAEVLGAFRIRDSLTVDGTAKVAGKLTVSSDIAAGVALPQPETWLSAGLPQARFTMTQTTRRTTSIPTGRAT